MSDRVSAPLSTELLAEIRAVDPGDWCAGPWTQDPVEGPEGEAGHFVVKDATGTTVATLPHWAGSLALFIAVARDGMPALLTEFERHTKVLADVTTVLASRNEGPTDGALLGRIAGIVGRIEAAGGADHA